MNCPNCGFENKEGSRSCVQCGRIIVSEAYLQNPDMEITLLRESTGESIVLDGDSEVIGKGSQASCRIDGNPAISRLHSKIYRADGCVYVEDMNSSNCTFVNGVRISSPVEVKDGTCIQLANELFIVQIKQIHDNNNYSSGSVYCGNCGAEVPPGSAFCGNCGVKV